MAVVVGLAVALAGIARPGTAPDGPWSCPATHPIKGYLSESGRRLYFLPTSRYYDEASPERCYRTEDEARRDGADPFGWERNFPIADRCGTRDAAVSCAHEVARPSRRL